jgi:superfamily II DNA or RNA helicase
MPDASDLPLSSWRFAGTLRSYQRDILDRVALPAERLHIVAPPGAGKTLVGLLLAMRDGRRAVVFAPTVTIRRQWARTARTLVPAAAAPADAPGASGSTGPVAEPEARSAAGTDAAPGGSVSEAPEHPADFTALTYQMISVVGDSSPFDALARETWVSELVAAGRAEDEARAWVDGLEQQNATAWRAGIRRRAARARKASVADDPEAIARVLHPNAVALIDLLVRDGVRTVILDECHHLLDHWALVVRYLAARIRATGDRPPLIGLTAHCPLTMTRTTTTMPTCWGRSTTRSPRRP